MSAFHIVDKEWRPVKLICALPMGQFLVEEADRALPGRFVAFRSDLRVEAGVYVYRGGL